MPHGTRVVITGVGVVNAGIVGDSAALGAFLAAPRAVAGVAEGGVARVPSSAIAGVIDVGDARRLSRVCQLSIAAAKLAMQESGVDAARGLGLVVGTEFGDLASTHVFADGFLERGPSGLSPLLFPNTVMNTMAAPSPRPPPVTRTRRAVSAISAAPVPSRARRSGRRSRRSWR